VTATGGNGTTDGADIATWEEYAHAERFLPWNAASLAFELDLEPNWIEGGDAFWFRAITRAGPRFVKVDPAAASLGPAFDHVRLAAALSVAGGAPVDPANLPFATIEVVEGGGAVRVPFAEARWTCDLATYTCTRGDAETPEPADVVRSPDGCYEVFVRDHNLWLRTVEGDAERALTTEGEAGYAFGAPLASPLGSAGLADPDKPVAIWAPDSSRFLTCRIDQRQGEFFHLVQSVPKDGAIRPRLHTYAYPLPGDEQVPLAEVWCFAVAEGSAGVRAALDPLPMLYYGNPLNPNWVWWSKVGDRVYLLTRDRGFCAYRLREIETATGAVRQVLEETAEHGIDPYLHWGAVTARVIGDGAEAIWPAQRDGWGHLYLYDGQTGELKRQLTSGAANVSEVMHVDEAERWLYFTAVGREAGRDPYYQHLYRVGLDGGEPELLTPEDADHSVVFTPSGRYFLDAASRVDQPPVVRLRSAAGAEVREVQRADVEPLLATGWRTPERFQAKARDGRTDVYGVILRPSTFDPSKRYPVIDYIYAGPQVNVAPASFADSAPFSEARRAGRGRGFWHAQALAELGFVVVMVDGLGMPGRSKAYHNVTYRNLGDGGIEDHIAALRQLGGRYPYLDLGRVGIYGHSAGGYASAHAILAFPDFYKVCVSTAGNHDHRLDKANWVERYMGLPVGEHYKEQANQTLAGRLKGKLLLMHGDMDENVHPASTMVLVDALIKANKDFDLLIMPNLPHRMDGDPYFVRRRWDYFVRHLRGATPPAGYRIAEARADAVWPRSNPE
jgi:dienelactone hydrolase